MVLLLHVEGIHEGIAMNTNETPTPMTDEEFASKRQVYTVGTT